jgi:hypothetical protein
MLSIANALFTSFSYFFKKKLIHLIVKKVPILASETRLSTLQADYLLKTCVV